MEVSSLKTCFLVPRIALGENVGLHLFGNVKLICDVLAHSFLKKMCLCNLKALPYGDFTFFVIQLKPASFLKVKLLNLVGFCKKMYILDFLAYEYHKNTV